MLKVDGLTKIFGGLRAVDDASLEVGEGRIVALIGPNGAGKTTLFASIAGFHPVMHPYPTPEVLRILRSPRQVHQIQPAFFGPGIVTIGTVRFQKCPAHSGRKTRRYFRWSGRGGGHGRLVELPRTYFRNRRATCSSRSSPACSASLSVSSTKGLRRGSPQ